MRSIVELQDLGGRVALVTGAGGHLGATACETLRELGAKVAGVDMVEAPAADLSIQADLADESGVRAVPGRVVEEFGSLDIVVTAAALVGTSGLQGWAVPFEDQSAATWREALETNLTSIFVLVQAAKDALAQSRSGAVVNIASIYGLVGPDPGIYEGTSLGNPAAYAASKGGLLQLTRWMATTLAPDIRVNAISPGGVLRGQPAEFVEQYERRTPLHRMATEEDLKGAIAYLATDLSAYVTGHNLVVDGGWTAW